MPWWCFTSIDLINFMFYCKIAIIFLPFWQYNHVFWVIKIQRTIWLRQFFEYLQQSDWDGSFEYPQHMFRTRNSKNNVQLRTLLWRPGFFNSLLYSKTCVKWPLSKDRKLFFNLCKTATLKRQKSGFQDQLPLNIGQKYCRMLQREHSAILLTLIKLPVVIKTFVLSFWEAILHRFYCKTVWLVSVCEM